MSIPQLFAVAVQHHRAGRLAEAEALYREILAVEPRHAEALHLLGVIAHQVGQNDLAVEMIRQAIALDPGFAEARYNFGLALQAMGQLDEAMAAYRQAIALKPCYPKAYNNLGLALKDKGQRDEAMAAYRQAIALDPGYPEAHNNLGDMLNARGQLDEAVAAHRQAIALKPDYAEACNNLGVDLYGKGQPEEAIAACRQAIALRPGYAEAYYNLGIVLRAEGRFDEAIAAYREAIALRPNYAEAHNNFGNALKDKGQLDEAVVAYRRAIALDPAFPKAHYNLGIGLYLKGELDEAIAACRQAIALKPDDPRAHNNLGNCLHDKGQLDEAIAVYRQAHSLDPGNPEVHNNLAYALLLQGNFSEAWKEYEWRWKCEDFPSPDRAFAQPQWNGAPLAGRTLLLHAEQGFGDAVQFIRYVPLVAQRGGNLIIECQPELQRLFRSMTPDLPVVARGEHLPAFEVHCPLLSLPGIFATDLSNIPGNVPYLRAGDPEATAWRERLAGDGSRLKVGLVWAGRPTHGKDRSRSLKLADLAPVAEVSGVRFYSLQKGDAGAEAKSPPRGMELVDVAEELNDFADTAGLIANLDLVIAVDTAVVHLAGAMGKPVWTLLPFVPDWRWLLGRNDSPWYPTMRLFRQPKIGDWDTVMAEVCAQLQLLVRKRREAS